MAITIVEIREAGRIAKEKHPVNPRFITSYPENALHELNRYRERNDIFEGLERHDYYGAIEEELLEVVTAKTRDERHIEIVQAIALLIRLDEDENI